MKESSRQKLKIGKKGAELRATSLSAKQEGATEDVERDVREEGGVDAKRKERVRETKRKEGKGKEQATSEKVWKANQARANE